MTALSLAPSGAAYTIKWNVCAEESAVLTDKFGLCPGESVFLTNSFFGSVIVNVNGKRVALGEEVAFRIKV